MSVVGDIFRSYRAPLRVARERLSRASEPRALATLMAACLLIFVAQWPRLAREAQLDPSVALDARIGGALFGWVFIMPLVFYALAALIWAVFRITGRSPGGLALRYSLFWSLLAAAPLWLANGFFFGFLGRNLLTDAIGIALLIAVIVFFGSGLKAALDVPNARVTE